MLIAINYVSYYNQKPKLTINRCILNCVPCSMQHCSYCTEVSYFTTFTRVNSRGYQIISTTKIVVLNCSNYTIWVFFILSERSYVTLCRRNHMSMRVCTLFSNRLVKNKALDNAWWEKKTTSFWFFF